VDEFHKEKGEGTNTWKGLRTLDPVPDFIYMSATPYYNARDIVVPIMTAILHLFEPRVDKKVTV